MREIEIQAGEETRILVRHIRSIPETIEFDAEPLTSGEDISGTVEVRRSGWTIPKKPEPQPLAAVNQVEKGPWELSFSIWVIPETDVRIRLYTSATYRLFWLIMAIAIVAVLAAGAFIVLMEV